jgi:hypothetical protein
VLGRARVILLAAVLTGVAAAAQPASARLVLPKQGEVVRLAGSGVECTWGRNGGLAAVTCRLADARHRPLAGTYGARLAESGRVDVVAAGSGASVFTRGTSAAAAAPRPPLRVGDALHVPGTALSCSIVNADGAAAICFRSDARGPRPKAYGFAVGRRVVIVMAYDEARRPTSAGAWPQRVR